MNKQQQTVTHLSLLFKLSLSCRLLLGVLLLQLFQSVNVHTWLSQNLRPYTSVHPMSKTHWTTHDISPSTGLTCGRVLKKGLNKQINK